MPDGREPNFASDSDGESVDHATDTTYEKGRSVSDAEMAKLSLRPHEFHGEWNYTIVPRQNLDNGST